MLITYIIKDFLNKEIKSPSYNSMNRLQNAWTNVCHAVIIYINDNRKIRIYRNTFKY